MIAIPFRRAGASPRRFSLCVHAAELRKGTRGFTLTELLMTCAVVGILAAIATPSIEKVSRTLRIEGSAQAFVGDLNRARTLAIRNNDNVTVALTGAQAYRIAGVGTRNLDEEVRFTGTSPDSVSFTGFGSTVDGREVYTLRLGELERQIVLDAAGQARVE
jgi:prepilin-type N-terminal cleavage/methylation domain-containing protein